MRYKYNLRATCDNCLTHYCCWMCAIAQEYREVKRRVAAKHALRVAVHVRRGDTFRYVADNTGNNTGENTGLFACVLAVMPTLFCLGCHVLEYTSLVRLSI